MSGASIARTAVVLIAAATLMAFAPGIGRADASLAGVVVFRRSPIGATSDAISGVWIVNADGTCAHQLVTNGASNIDPAISADGSQVAWSQLSLGANDRAIYKMDLATHTTVLVYDTPGLDDVYPTWAPGGQQLAWVVQPTSGPLYSDIYTMTVGNPNTLQNITQTSSDGEFDPDWSPILTDMLPNIQIVFSSTVWTHSQGNPEITRMAPQYGAAQTRLTTDGGQDQAPHWSPDGTKVAFRTNPPQFGGNYDIYTVDAKTGGAGGWTRLTTSTAIDRHPSWSPDGTVLAFVSNRAPFNHFQLWTMTSTGAAQTPLFASDTGFDDTHPEWGPGNACT